MKIAIAKDGNQVSEHFGHCERYGIYVATDSIIYRTDDLINPGHEPGRLPVFLAEHGVTHVIAGGMGQRAIEIFNQNGISVMVGVSGNVDIVAQDFIAGKITPGDSTCHHHEG
ncbi:MAG: NifB/NifX family molybdenum-iron cluster-binding protein [Methanomicrobiaceae archaeon]|uniref:Dinitrogenase iron-molybdenum cofactor biosynthesis domain-containing protein n=1 Tax=hydrocarbon metagenome TaxID=938273 RepID=A0A0W8FDB3_9ZZZZ|nr:NifB/NifX family molybdenum-iron cluster-binding protein [Methanomicrobiaceae archaeon]MDD5419550.1 NifB/NifX family molybdenum-iron cluster-binding protein [Methanomicrobiaceae archaeon]